MRRAWPTWRSSPSATRGRSRTPTRCTTRPGSRPRPSRIRPAARSPSPRWPRWSSRAAAARSGCGGSCPRARARTSSRASPRPAPRPATIVVVAHHDAARGGLFWHPRLAGLTAARNARRRAIDGYLQPAAAGYALAALPSRAARAAGAALLAAALAAALDIARSPTVPGASDNATGVAALLALAAELAADPLPATDVVLLSAGCEESGMGGMAAYLRDHAPDPARTFVLGLDTLGAGTPIQLRAEGVIRAHAYGERDLDRVDAAAAAAGLPAPPRWRLGGWTDPILARFAGIPAVSILSMGGGMIPEYHRPTDTPERVDWGCVDACLALARAVLENWGWRFSRNALTPSAKSADAAHRSCATTSSSSVVESAGPRGRVHHPLRERDRGRRAGQQLARELPRPPRRAPPRARPGWRGRSARPPRPRSASRS